ncbi:MAG: histidine kinase [Prevotella sp.]|nr:histidine kinase [Prevotella sp.]
MAKYSHILFTIAITASALFVSCDDRCDKNIRSTQQASRMHMLSDTIGVGNDHYVHICDSLLLLTTDSMDYYDLMVEKGMRYTVANPIDSLLYYADHVWRFASSRPATDKRANGLKARALTLRATYYHQMRINNDSSLTLFRRSYDLMMQSDYLFKTPDAAANLGDAYALRDDMPSAAFWYRRALFLADSLNIPVTETASIYMGLGRIYTAMQDYTSAMKFYEKAEKNIHLLKPNMQIYFLNNYGNLFYFNKEYHKALNMFRRMQQVIEKHEGNDAADSYLCRINMADVYLNIGNTDSATILLDKAEPFYRKYNVEVCLYYIGTIRIGVAVRQGDFAKVPEIMSKEHFTQPIEQSIKNIRSRYLTEYYQKTGDWRNALLLTQQTRREEDSLAHNKFNMRTAEIMSRFTADTLMLHHQLALEKKNEEMMKTKVTLAFVVMICIILVLAFSYSMLYLRKRRLQHHINMVMLRLENVRQRISPHFIFNLLNHQIVGKEKDEKALQDLSHIIRCSLDVMSQLFIHLQDELDFINQYVALEKRIIDKDFDFKLDVQCDISKVVVPSMLVQILVENAIKHGIKCGDGQKKLSVRVTNNGNATVIDVEDNGPGFDIRHQCDTPIATGLKVIRQTLAIVNDRSKGKLEFHISNLTSPEGDVKGCRASIVVPNDIAYLLKK